MIILSLVLTPILKKLIDKAWDDVADEIEAIRDVHNSVKSLSSKLKNLENYFSESEKVQGKEKVDIWIDELKDVAFDSEDILDLFATRSDRFKWKKDHANSYSVFEPVVDRLSDIWSKKETADAVKELLMHLDEINKQRNEFLTLKQGYTNPESSRNQAGKREAGPAVDASSIIGREDEKNKIIASLIDQSSEKVHIVPILGIGGVGKTTLAQLVYNDAKIQEHFADLRRWVSVTNDFNLNRILREIKELDPELKKHSSKAPGSLQTTASQFLSEKRFLIVIDDVWTMHPRDWESLKGIFQSGANGSSVVVTSRELDHIKMMVPNYPDIKPLGKLSYADGWKLFWNIAAVNGGPTKELEDIGKEIIEKCQGLPLAITAIAGALRGKDDIKRWMKMVKDDFSKIEKQSHDPNFEILSVLKVSFDHLPPSLKPCFLLCSLLPKGRPLVKTELVKIWMAEGYISFEENPEDLGDEYFDDLCNRSFFLRSNVRGYDVYTMHDLFHDMAVFVSDGSCLQLKDQPLPKIDTKTRHISLRCENIEKPTLEVISKDQKQKLRTILIPGDNLRIFGNTLEDLFRSLKFIRVLDLSSSSIDELPDLFKELHLLRYLDLSATGIRILPKSICDLWNLQTLRLLHCLMLTELPKDLSKLVSLRHLELDERFWLKLSEFPPGAGNLTNLQTLTKFWVRREKGYEINELGSLDSLTGKLHLLGLENVDNNAGEAKLHKKENLDHLVFEWTKKEEPPAPVKDTNTLSGLKPHSNIKVLHIINFGGKEFPAWISNGLLKNLTTLSLSHCTNCRILSVGEVRKLKKISLTDMPELKEWKSENGNRWVLNPQTLEIIRCPNLGILPDEFEDLRTLEIKDCGSLQNLPAAPSLTSLTLIDNASLENWNKNIAIRNPIVMKLHSCSKLKSYPDHVHVSKLDISDCGECGKQRDLPPAKNPKPTEHLKLNGSLTNLSPHSNSLMTLQFSDISQLSSLNDLPCLVMLKALYINGCNGLKHLWEEDGDLHSLTPALTYLSVKNCPNLITLTESGLPAKLESLVIASCTGLVSLGSDVTFKDLTSLKNITIENCHSLMSLPVDNFPSSLKHLKFVDCAQLKEIVNNIPGSSDRRIEFVNRTNRHEPGPAVAPEPGPAVAPEPGPESVTVANSAGTESSQVKRSGKCCCLM